MFREILCVFGVAVLLAACTNPGRIWIVQEDGTEIEVEQPGKAVTPATVTVGEVTVTTGAAQEQTPAMIAADKTWIAWVIGPLLMLVGIGAFVAKKWFPLIPTTAGTYTIAAGAAVMTLAIGLPSLPSWVWIAVAVGLGAWLILPGVISNIKGAKRQKGTS